MHKYCIIFLSTSLFLLLTFGCKKADKEFVADDENLMVRLTGIENDENKTFDLLANTTKDTYNPEDTENKITSTPFSMLCIALHQITLQYLKNLLKPLNTLPASSHLEKITLIGY